MTRYTVFDLTEGEPPDSLLITGSLGREVRVSCWKPRTNLTGEPDSVQDPNTAFMQQRHVRLKSRAENRQAWINSIRTEISALIAAFPPPQASDRMIDAAFLEIQQNFTKLELYLNPSEQVHRGFMAVIRFMYGFEGIDVDKEASKELCLPKTRYPWRNQNTASARDEWLEWRTKSIRLANVLLKREWEQVKHIK